MSIYGSMGIPVNEQETVITIDRETGEATIYTCDTRYMNRLSKIYEQIDLRNDNGKVVALKFKVPEKLISFRKGIVKRNLSEEQRKALSERLKAQRKKE
jgi:hypothetical protein